MCRKAKLTIFNREFGRRDLLIATAYVDFDDITKLDNDPIISGGKSFDLFLIYMRSHCFTCE